MLVPGVECGAPVGVACLWPYFRGSEQEINILNTQHMFCVSFIVTLDMYL